MSDFHNFGSVVNHAYNSILRKDGGKKNNVFLVEISGDQLFEHYLASFPEGTNQRFRERAEYDCSTCRNFIKNLGAVVYIDKDEIHSVWDVKIDNEKYQAVADSMAQLVKSLPIAQRFVVGEPSYGAEKTNTKGETWSHFHGKVPSIFVARNNDSNYVGESKNDMEGLRRSIDKISDDAIEIVLELIAQDSLYKGPQKRSIIENLSKLKRAYAKLTTDREREIFLWINSTPATRVHSDVVGTLMTDISEGVELEIAVKKYEDKTAGPNYMRPKALVSQKMIDAARKDVEKLGLEDSLARRYAVREDISVNDVLFVDGSVKPKLLGGAFDGIKPTKKDAPNFDAIEEIGIKDFISKVLPKADTVEVFLKNAHLPNFVSLIAPVHAEAKPLFKWDNGFSWSYDGEVTDSIRERVKNAGGKVDGAMRLSLSWKNADDLDLSVSHGGDTIDFRHRRAFGAELDLDMNGMDKHDDEAPVENIVWAHERDVKPGRYEIRVHNYNKRDTSNVGFEVEVDAFGQLYSFEHPKDLRNNDRIVIGTISVGRDGKVTVEGLKAGGSSNEKWGLSTETWVPVDLITRSPNFWNDQKIGHEHVFFMLKGCVHEDSTRGFYNEYLREELDKHRKAFELVSAQLKAPFSENQLSGLGFSVTKRAELQVRVKGAITRIMNVKF